MWIILGGGIVLALVIAGIYNVFVRGKNLVQEAWSGIDVQLKRRHDLIPGFVDVVKGYVQHERVTLEKVVELRSKATGTTDLARRAELENGISQGLKSIFAVVEGYPNLKADQHFLELQKTLTQVEDEIQLARRYYNGKVRDYNITVESFPNSLLARVFEFKKAEFFEIESATERAVPDLKL